VEIGKPLCEVVDASPRNVRVEAVLTQRQAWIYSLEKDEYEVEIRRMSDVGGTIPGRVTEVITPGQELPHASLGFAGGGQIPTESRDESGRMASTPQPLAYVEPLVGAGQSPLAFIDERVSLRFTLPAKPLAVQWWDRLSKLMQGRVNM
jgi:hypothetical protein